MDVEKFLGWAEGKGWTVERRTVPLSLPKIITDRYEIPGLYKEFLEKALLCSGPMDTEWFLCEEGYRQDDPDAIRWNECEQISLEAARDLSDQEEERRVTQFWDGVLPFFLSVGSGYEYYGFDLLGRFGPAGGILHGFEPMFEEAERFAPDFPAFLDKVAAGEVSTGGVLFDPEEYAFMEMAGRKEQERLERESAQALRSLLHPEEEHCHDHGDGCGCDHDHH
ncbi:MAG: hypothetical protein HFF10_02790 [Angelakisella sp.]|jgi:hypothetical protein|nr:hypothetical protein [Angelakisella sp.]